MSKSKTTSAPNDEFLKGLGLNPNAKGLSAAPATPERDDDVVLAPEGVDPHTMPVSDIVFDPRLLDEFDDLGYAKPGRGGEAKDKVFDLYKSHGRNRDRNRRLYDEIGLFIRRVEIARKAGETPTAEKPKIKDKVRATKKQRELLAYLEAQGITSLDDLIAALNTEEN